MWESERAAEEVQLGDMIRPETRLDSISRRQASRQKKWQPEALEVPCSHVDWGIDLEIIVIHV